MIEPIFASKLWYGPEVIINSVNKEETKEKLGDRVSEKLCALHLSAIGATLLIPIETRLTYEAFSMIIPK